MIISSPQVVVVEGRVQSPLRGAAHYGSARMEYTHHTLCTWRQTLTFMADSPVTKYWTAARLH